MRKPTGNYRYRILALLFAATSINYFDRSIMGVMSPDLIEWFGWTKKDYSHVLIAFQIAYAIGLLSMGGIIDRMGTKKGYVLSIALWSFFGMMHAAVGRGFSLTGFSLARLGLGFGEAGNFPVRSRRPPSGFQKKSAPSRPGFSTRRPASERSRPPSWSAASFTGAVEPRAKAS